MIAWAAVTGEVSTSAVLMFLVIFIWTPPHFWALALFRNEDYARVGVPMMPVVAGEVSTRRQIWLYTLVLVPVSLAPAFTVAGGPVYLAVALVANAAFLRCAWRVARRGQERAAADGYRAEKKMFGVSILYLESGRWRHRLAGLALKWVMQCVRNTNYTAAAAVAILACWQFCWLLPGCCSG
jgi:protoheme IX farnesyltransferase